MSYTMIDGGKAIRCGECGAVSYNRNDIQHKYCTRCHKYHGNAPIAGVRTWITRDELAQRYPEDYPPYRYAGPELSDAAPAPAADVCRAEPDDARPSSSDIDYGSSSSSDYSSPSDSGSCGGGD